MTVSVPTALVSFRDGTEPRALAARLIAVAEKHARGWTLNVPGHGSTEHLTFDSVPPTVAAATGIERFAIIWDQERPS
jgi:hypothetical protein